MADDVIAELTAALMRDQSAYRQGVAGLERALPLPMAHLADALLEHAEFFGPDATRASITRDPAAHGLTVEQAQDIATRVAEIQALSESLDATIAKREKLLAAKDPDRVRRYMVGGDEYVIDRSKGTMERIETREMRQLPLGLGPPQPRRKRERHL